jgi:hypothetical protein
MTTNNIIILVKSIEIKAAIKKKFNTSMRDENIPSITTPRQVISSKNSFQIGYSILKSFYCNSMYFIVC